MHFSGVSTTASNPGGGHGGFCAEADFMRTRADARNAIIDDWCNMFCKANGLI
jgi:hypothetical protein